MRHCASGALRLTLCVKRWTSSTGLPVLHNHKSIKPKLNSCEMKYIWTLLQLLHPVEAGWQARCSTEVKLRLCREKTKEFLLSFFLMCFLISNGTLNFHVGHMPVVLRTAQDSAPRPGYSHSNLTQVVQSKWQMFCNSRRINARAL